MTPSTPRPLSRILILAGEVSGDAYGAALSEALRKESPGVYLVGVGGDQLRSQCDDFLFETAYHNAIGIKESLASRWGQPRLLQSLTPYLETHSIDLVILIDFQHHNFKLASLFQHFKIPIVTFITPNFWLWKDIKKAKKIVSYSRDIVTIFPQEYAFYRSLTDRVHYFGHPLIQMIGSHGDSLKNPLEKTRPIITLFPGSRRQEIDLLLPAMIDTLTLLSQKGQAYHYYLALSSERFLPQIQKILSRKPHPPLSIWKGKKEELLKETDFLLCASGSSTIEAMLYHIPMVIFGALPHVTYWIARLILRLHKKMPLIALPNIIAGREIIPEYVQYHIEPKHIARFIDTYFHRPLSSRWKQDYEAVITALSPHPFPLEKIAKLIFNTECVINSVHEKTILSGRL